MLSECAHFCYPLPSGNQKGVQICTFALGRGDPAPRSVFLRLQGAALSIPHTPPGSNTSDLIPCSTTPCLAPLKYSLEYGFHLFLWETCLRSQKVPSLCHLLIPAPSYLFSKPMQRLFLPCKTHTTGKQQ